MHPVYIIWNFYFFKLISSNFRPRWWITAERLWVCCQTYLMTHSNITKNMRYRERYNTALCRTRVLIEQTYRILKRKFPCFALSLRTDQGRICQYVVASMVLHCFGTPATWHFHTQPWWPYDSRTRHPGHCRSSQPQRLSLQKVHCRAVFRSLNYSCENIYQWQNKHVFIYLYIQN